ncbi:MAG: hypothetical protein K0R51_2655 [Cytophagaceae bacterium]|jgi:hypothetical protein|nr:hypothetical protein [Cytophagaceae bacterium]
MKYTIEYLITIETKGGFCNSVETFNNLLKAYSEISILPSTIKYKDIEVVYFINTDEVPNQNQRYFHVSFSLVDIKHEEVFLELLRKFRDIIYKANGKISVLWDGLSSHYSTQSYPLIHETENLMRKLISKFMLINLGMEWSSQTIPSEVKNSIKNKRSQSGTTDILHDVDFIQLSDFLFKRYQTKSLSSLYNLIEKIEKGEDFDNKHFLEYLPKSNWERYFSNLVDCDDGYLLKRWEKLYELRCLIAHNTVVSNKDFTDIKTYCNEINEKLNKAIKDLDKVVIPESEIESLHENVAGNLNELNGNFLEEWKTLQSNILEKLIKIGLEEDDLNVKITISSLMKLAEKYKILDKKIIGKIGELRNVRHQIVHESNRRIDARQIQDKTAELKQISSEVRTMKISNI